MDKKTKIKVISIIAGGIVTGITTASFRFYREKQKKKEEELVSQTTSEITKQVEEDHKKEREEKVDELLSNMQAETAEVMEEFKNNAKIICYDDIVKDLEERKRKYRENHMEAIQALHRTTEIIKEMENDDKSDNDLSYDLEIRSLVRKLDDLI